ncbi:MAG TPA: hypothetical protein VHX38_01470 [Pseudonocardiaceae bacterium]|nr:hypothetical protein [Pseudonocardiaceae bacterium]
MVDVAEVLNAVGVPWPDANTEKATDAANAWKALGAAAQTALEEGNNAANVLCANNTGQAMTAFSQYWDEFGGTGKAANLQVLVGCCNAMAQACNQFENAVTTARKDLAEKAAEITAAVGGGVLLTLVTAGFSDAAASAAVAAIVPEAVATFTLLGATVADIAGTVLAGAAMGLLETTMAQVTTAAIQLGFGQKPTMPTTLDEVNALVVGGFTGPIGAGIAGSAKAGTAAAAAGLSDDISVVAPKLPGLMNSLPDAVDTPAGKALVDLVSKTTASGMVNIAENKDPEMPSTEEVVGAMLDSKIESAADSGDG